MSCLKRVLAATVVALGTVPFAAADCPPYPEDIKPIVYQMLKNEDLVRDAYIGQEDCDLRSPRR